MAEPVPENTGFAQREGFGLQKCWENPRREKRFGRWPIITANAGGRQRIKSKESEAACGELAAWHPRRRKNGL